MMKKKVTKRLAITAVGIACAGAVSIGFPAYAELNAGSQGNIVFQDGEMALYASDVNYLQNELDTLFDEIPDVDKQSDTAVIDYTRRNHIQSKGIIDYAGGTVVIDSSDFIYMANQIDELENTYKQIVLKYLNGINTYLTADGSVTHDADSSDTDYFPKFEDLINGISLSQEVETATTMDNLSKDKGAWVNGTYLTGNGNDVNIAYSQGYIDGVNYTVENAKISYVYHEHTGEQSGEGTGCYKGYHQHVTDLCTMREKCGGHCNVIGTRSGSLGCCNGEYIRYKCSICNAEFEVYITSSPCHAGGNSDHYNTVTLPYCGTINSYKLICNKTEGVTIDSATITFD